MANFYKEFEKVVFNEGGYVNDPDDAGGETYMGISRKANPKWSGWTIIDALKKQMPHTFQKVLKHYDILTVRVEQIYREKYWDNMYLDNVKNEKLAHQVFDTAVNMGVSKAIKILQKTFGLKETGIMDDNLKKKLYD